MEEKITKKWYQRAWGFSVNLIITVSQFIQNTVIFKFITSNAGTLILSGIGVVLV